MKQNTVIIAIVLALLAPSTWAQTRVVKSAPKKTVQKKTTKKPTEWDISDLSYRLDEDLNPVEGDNGRWGFVDKSGKVILPFRWLYADSFREDLAVVQDVKENYGFIDKKGKLIIPCKWYDTRGFDEGKAKVADKNWHWHYINKKGEIIGDCKAPY